MAEACIRRTIRVDNENCMTNFFIDGSSKLDYECFKDVVIFDTTYLTYLSCFVTSGAGVPSKFDAWCTAYFLVVIGTNEIQDLREVNAIVLII